MLTAIATQALVQAYHRSEAELSDAELDEALGLTLPAPAHGSSELGPPQGQHPGESVVHLATPYSRCRGFFEAIQATEHDVIIDMGCGTGRLIVYGALVTRARLRGIELVPSRCAIAQRAVQRLRLSRAQIIQGNVLDQCLEDGTVFYAFRPFSTETEAKVVARLHALAQCRDITVGAYRLQPGLFDPQVFSCADRSDLRIYRSNGGRA